MKKILFIFVLLCADLFAMQKVSAQDGGTADGFHGYWFIQVQGGIGQTVGETSFGSLISPAAAFNFGYRFTPVWSLRAGVGGWQAKGAVVGPTQMYSYNYLQGNMDVLVDICSVFSGYRTGRAVSPYLFAGVGVNGAFNNAQAQSLASRFPADGYLWSGSNILPAGRFGVGTGIRITDAVRFNLEVNANCLGDKFNSKKGSAVDWQLGAMAGFTFNIGLRKGKSKPVASPEVASVPVQQETVSSEPAPAPESEPVSDAPAQVVVSAPEDAPSVAPEQKDAPAAPVFLEEKKDVFFKIGKYELRDSELANLEYVAKIAEENPQTMIEVTGYADPQTGSAKRNMYLSRKRAETVAKWLETSGVSADRIVVKYKGGTESPYETPAQNRVAICIVR